MEACKKKNKWENPSQNIYINIRHAEGMVNDDLLC